MPSKKRRSGGLSRWFKEEWIDVCQLPKIVKCGRSRAKGSKRRYPYCRPRKRVTSRSPTAYTQLSKKELQRRCRRKRKNPHKKVMPKKRSSRVKYRSNSRKRRSRRSIRRRSRKRISRRSRRNMMCRRRYGRKHHYHPSHRKSFKDGCMRDRDMK